MAAGGVYAQTKPKTLKELVAEEKAKKEAEKKAREEEKAKEEEEKAKREAARKAREERTKKVLEDDGTPAEGTTPEDAADFVTETDSSYWAPTNVKQLGAQNYGELYKPTSSLDLQDPNNISTTVDPDEDG